jgi:hypothetical protein
MLKVLKSVTREKSNGLQRSLLRTSQSSHQVTAQFQSRRPPFTRTAAQTSECARAEGLLRSLQTEGQAKVRGGRMDSTRISTYPLGKTRCSPTKVLPYPSRHPKWVTPSLYRSEQESAFISRTDPKHRCMEHATADYYGPRGVHVICLPTLSSWSTISAPSLLFHLAYC